MIKRNFKGVPLENFPLDLVDELCVLANKIEWDSLAYKSELFKQGYITLQPILRLIGLLILEKITNKSGAELLSQWLQIPYYQYFTGETLFHWELPISVGEIESCKTQLSKYAIETIDKNAFGVQI